MDLKTRTIEEVCSLVVDCPHSTPKWTGEGAIVLRSNNIKNGRLDQSSPSFTTEEHYLERIKRAEPTAGDLVITREAPMGEVCRIPENLRCCLGQRQVLLRPKCDSDFLLYAIQSPFVQRQIRGHDATGSTVSNLCIPDLKALRIPEFADESDIAKVLSTLDAKIEVNRRINEELESMAKLLYDHWFVQFDFPISAAQAAAMGRPDLEGKPYRASGGKMVHNETLKREIPEGWDVSTLAEFANITMGQSPPGSSYNRSGKGIVFFQGSTDFGWRFPEVREFTNAPSRLAKEGDILLSVRAPVGTLNVADQDCCIGRGLAALNAKDDCDSFLYEVMLYFKQIFDRRNTAGTTFGSITKDDLHGLQFSRPPADSKLLSSFESRVAPLRSLMVNNHRQNQHLTQLRDWLLPMLMNGQVTVASPPEESKSRKKGAAT